MHDQPPSQAKKMLIDIGDDVFVEAAVHDSTNVVVCIGLNIFVSLTLPKALEKIDQIVTNKGNTYHIFSLIYIFSDTLTKVFDERIAQARADLRTAAMLAEATQHD